MARDYFSTDARIADRLEGLRQTLSNPFLSLETKLEELHCAHDRIEFLEASRPLANGLSVLADLASVPGRDEE